MSRENNRLRKLIPSRQIILALLLLIIVCMQIAAAQIRSFWEDEAFTATVITKDFAGIIETVQGDDNPPLYWLSLSFWSKSFGTGELGLR
jgi:hypothetical protein